MVEKQIHFIGGGQMTEAIIRAIIHNETIAKENISVTDIDQSRNRYLTTTYGVEAETDQVHSLKDADLIIIAIRPQDDLVSVSKNIAEFGRKDAIVLSIVAGVTIEKIANHLGEPRPIVRVIPNTLTDTGFGYSGAALNSNANVEDVDWFLNGFGKVSYIDESLIDIFTGYGVAGPNYIYYFIESLVDAGVLAGLSRKQAWDVAIDNIQGAVAMLQQTGKHPRQLMDINNTAGGVGIHALYELNNSNFAEGLQRSVIAAAKRTTELGEGKIVATLQWDHTVQYVRDLEKTMGIFKENGLHAFFGGSHTKWGTYNALSYFGLTYIEFLGVENDELARNITEPNQVVKDAVKWLPDHEILSRVAIRTDDIDAVVNRLSENGLDHSPIMEGKRLNAQGQLIEWKMVTIAGDSQGLDYPFFIQWSQTDEERFGSLKEAGAITQHPAGDLTIQKAIFHVTNPVEVASHWNKVFGLSAIEQEGNEAKVNLGDKQFVFKQGNQNALTQLVFDASSSVLKGKTFKIGEGEYVFL